MKPLYACCFGAPAASQKDTQYVCCLVQRPDQSKKITAHNWKNYDPDNKSWLTSCRCVTAALKHLARMVNKPLSLQA